MKLPTVIEKPRIWFAVTAAHHSASWSKNTKPDGGRVTLVTCNVRCHIDWFSLPAIIERVTCFSQDSMVESAQFRVSGALPGMITDVLQASAVLGTDHLNNSAPLADRLSTVLNTLARYRPALFEYDSEAGVLRLTDFGVVTCCRPGITSDRLALENTP